MAQNTSSAVMQQRAEPRDSLDDFPTPPWATRALMEHVLIPAFGNPFRGQTAVEPSCNRGFMSRPLAEYFGKVVSSDVHHYGWSGQGHVGDFLIEGAPPGGEGADWLVMNPPFVLAPAFIHKALSLRPFGVAAFVRTSFLEGGERYAELFSRTPPTIYAQFAERVILTKGIVRDPGQKYWDHVAQKWRRPSSATSYCWLVWVSSAAQRPVTWIPPCRRKLERAGDYEVAL